MKAPVLGLYGEADTGIPVAAVEALKAALAAAHKTAEFKIYPGAPHGFHADYRASYRKDAAEDGWNQMQAWLRKYQVLSRPARFLGRARCLPRAFFGRIAARPSRSDRCCGAAWTARSPRASTRRPRPGRQRRPETATSGRGL